jgi:murein L,D-transpeptidase YcbB/YkuD
VGSRADVLGWLLDCRAQDGSIAEAQVKSAGHVKQIVARERSALKGRVVYDESKHPRATSGPGGGRFVRKGSSGTAVKRVQKKLGIAQTGAFAFDTQAAVQSFQREHGLQVDGVVGAQTAQALLGNRNAKVVKPGALSAADAKALGFTSKSSKRTKAKKSPAHKPSAPTRIGGGFAV